MRPGASSQIWSGDSDFKLRSLPPEDQNSKAGPKYSFLGKFIAKTRMILKNLSMADSRVQRGAQVWDVQFTRTQGSLSAMFRGFIKVHVWLQ